MGFVGSYGSGKTEVAVNYVLQLAAAGARGRVSIADLDIVNPYFRCREAIGPLEQQGVRVVVPRGANMYAELPIILPEVRGLLSQRDRISVLDVGGDDVGARALSHLAADFPADYELWQVLNSRRPFTDTVAGCLRLRAQIEESSRLGVTGLVANTHLLDETTAEIITQGYELACQVAAAAQLPLRLVVVGEHLAGEVGQLDAPVMIINRMMNPPWVDDRKSLGWAGERERLRLMGGKHA